MILVVAFILFLLTAPYVPSDHVALAIFLPSLVLVIAGVIKQAREAGEGRTTWLVHCAKLLYKWL